MPTASLPKGSALGIPDPHLGMGRPGHAAGREAGQEEASRAPATVRGNEEKQLQSAPEARPGKTLQLELTQRTFQTLRPRCPASVFFTAIRVTRLSKGQQLARVSRKLVWPQAGIGATLTS